MGRSSSPGSCVVGFQAILVSVLFQAVVTYDKIFMGHATVKPDYQYVCRQRQVYNTLGGRIDSRKEYYEAGLQDCTILLTSPPGTLIDFRFTDIDIIASNLNTCHDASLRIYDGSTNATSLLLGFPNGICGQGVPSFHIRSTSNTMLLQLTVTSPYTSSFSAIYTAYSPRTSVHCFYCGDLCLQNAQLCDGLDNCWDGEDEQIEDCGNEPPPPINNTHDKYEEDLKLILILVLGGMAIIFLVLIIAILLRKKVMRSCVDKRRQRRAAAAAHLMLHPPLTPHMYAPRTGSGNSRGAPTVVGVGYRPFMAGHTVNIPGRSSGRVPRSDMPPPYSAVPGGAELVVENNAASNGRRINVFDASRENAYSENPLYVPDDDPQPHISDDDEIGQDTSTNSHTIINYNSRVRDTEISTDTQDRETSFIGKSVLSRSNDSTPTANISNDASDDQPRMSAGNAASDVINSQHGAALDETVTDVTVVQPENVIDNSPVHVSTRDAICVIENMDIGLANTDDGDNKHEDVVYL